MLSQNLQRFQKHTEKLRRAYHEAGQPPYTSNPVLQQASRQMIVVRLQDYWSQFVRSLIVLSASGKATTLGGSGISNTQSLTSFGMVESWLNGHKRGSREPDWHVSHVSLRLAKQLGISNLHSISAALGSTNSPEQNVRTYRNYIVHRNQDTASRLRTSIRNQGLRPTQLHTLPDEYVTGGVKLIDEWVQNFQLIAKVASN